MKNRILNKNQGSAARQNTRPVPTRARELLSDQSNGLPVWIRSPKQGVEFYSGFSRAKLYEGAARGLFRSVSIRQPGQVKGTRLFHLQSILDYINRCEQAAQPTEEKATFPEGFQSPAKQTEPATLKLVLCQPDNIENSERRRE